MSSARDEILARIRAALAKPDEHTPAQPDWEAPIYAEPTSEDLVIGFSEVFESRGGVFHFVESPEAFFAQAAALVAERGWSSVACADPTLQDWLAEAGVASSYDPATLGEAEVSFTFCEALVARTGSALVSSRQTRALTIYPPIHIIVAFATQTVPDIGHALGYLRQLYPDGLPSMISLVTGPSRTADIEKTLVLGAHGPKELHIMLIDDATPAS